MRLNKIMNFYRICEFCQNSSIFVIIWQKTYQALQYSAYFVANFFCITFYNKIKLSIGFENSFVCFRSQMSGHQVSQYRSI